MMDKKAAAQRLLNLIHMNPGIVIFDCTRVMREEEIRRWNNLII